MTRAEDTVTTARDRIEEASEWILHCSSLIQCVAAVAEVGVHPDILSEAMATISDMMRWVYERIDHELYRPDPEEEAEV
ncbi:MAG: hypothetical protein LUH09_06625 [Clostridiales bacterium]|nr:hypothetical protein [Clostridiales bacterium]